MPHKSNTDGIFVGKWILIKMSEKQKHQLVRIKQKLFKIGLCTYKQIRNNNIIPLCNINFKKIISSLPVQTRILI